MKSAKIGDKVKQKKLKKHQMNFVYIVKDVSADGKKAYLGIAGWSNVKDLTKYNG